MLICIIVVLFLSPSWWWPIITVYWNPLPVFEGINTSFNIIQRHYNFCIDPSVPLARSISKQVPHSQPCRCLSEHPCLSQRKVTEGWTKAQMWHRKCPWGGHLVKFDTWPQHFLGHHFRSKQCASRNTTMCKVVGCPCKETNVRIPWWNCEPTEFLVAGLTPGPLNMPPISSDLILESAFKGLSAAYRPLTRFRMWLSLFDIVW